MVVCDAPEFQVLPITLECGQEILKTAAWAQYLKLYVIQNNSNIATVKIGGADGKALGTGGVVDVGQHLFSYVYGWL